MKKLILLLFVLASNLSAMCWQWKDVKDRDVSVSFIPIESSISAKVDLVIKCDAVFIKSLPEKYQKLFKFVGKTYMYSTLENYQERSQASLNEADPENTDVVFSTLICKGNPQNISERELAEIIKNKRVIFYTGAGISAGSIPSMDQLMNDLKITKETSKKLEEYITDLITNSESYINILKNFFDKCENALPSDAHNILARLIQKRGQLLITENLDQLHQKTGLTPIVLAGNDNYSQGEFSERIREEVLRSDFVITIGLNSDESGFLKFYKKLNPDGKIISINLKNTNYLSDDDFILKEDIQQVFKKLISYM
jgi:NAD-dependent SIR2 family protein deacetylase